ncbi:hypothetical protein CAPTEDRAFT_207501 [Capitella teleta]|uniref:Uncharacterized protein n=1 Tax=Capitella teleta TaxID=283909 RepID=R7UZK0_CAPTE|nr:hypothetical protein CAPTEDRAFT_207501 [Capitella teleta]|eukprot:ELU11709.1 hypothetical protein CAPTEDRAFT_207501 [Capitella teleta]
MAPNTEKKASACDISSTDPLGWRPQIISDSYANVEDDLKRIAAEAEIHWRLAIMRALSVHAEMEGRMPRRIEQGFKIKTQASIWGYVALLDMTTNIHMGNFIGKALHAEWFSRMRLTSQLLCGQSYE